LGWLWPVAAFNVLVLLASMNPSFHAMKHGAETVLVHEGERAGMPSSAQPELALKALWLFDATWISCFNLALVIRQRRTVRYALLLAFANALLLAVFGTAQKLTGAHGLFFDAVPSPQTHFFATFVYHNHWGAFMVLMMATGIGLVWHYGRRRDARDFFHTPAFAGIVVVVVLAASVPLSLSRSCTLLAIGLVGVTSIHFCARLIRRRRQFRESIVLPLAGAGAAVALGTAAVWFVAGDSITQRMAKTREQVHEMRVRGTVGDRATLYRDTWRMAQEKPWFGWGMGSYPHVFTLYNTQTSVDRLPVFYHDAHSDWLQALAEHGFVGTTLLGLCALVPLLRLRRRHFSSPLPLYLLIGCGLIVLYAWVEFPFGNVAVVLTWWFCFFCAVQYARLQDREAPTSSKAAAAS
jgi:O-antigen ligase